MLIISANGLSAKYDINAMASRQGEADKFYVGITGVGAKMGEYF